MSNFLESPNATSLRTAQQAFEHWRQTRTQRSVTPEVLRKQAVSLITKHRRAHICAALRINDQALKQWERELAEANNLQPIEHQRREPSRPDKAFIELPVHQARTCEFIHSMPITAVRIDLPNGTVMRTDQVFSLEQILSASCASLETEV